MKKTKASPKKQARRSLKPISVRSSSQKPDTKPVKKWWIVQLSSNGEAEPLSNLVIHFKALTKNPNLELFIPAHSHKAIDDCEFTEFLYPGYFFVSTTSLVEPSVLTTSPFVSQLLVSPSGYSTLRDVEVDAIRKQLSKFKVVESRIGDRVTITQGPYKSLTGEVVGHDGDKLVVSLNFRSLTDEVSVPKFMVERI